MKIQKLVNHDSPYSINNIEKLFKLSVSVSKFTPFFFFLLLFLNFNSFPSYTNDSRFSKINVTIHVFRMYGGSHLSSPCFSFRSFYVKKTCELVVHSRSWLTTPKFFMESLVCEEIFWPAVLWFPEVMQILKCILCSNFWMIRPFWPTKDTEKCFLTLDFNKLSQIFMKVL